jgi:hypothetical protein
MLLFMICSLRVGDVECDVPRRVPLLFFVVFATKSNCVEL